MFRCILAPFNAWAMWQPGCVSQPVTIPIPFAAVGPAEAVGAILVIPGPKGRPDEVETIEGWVNQTILRIPPSKRPTLANLFIPSGYTHTKSRSMDLRNLNSFFLPEKLVPVFHPGGKFRGGVGVD